MKGELDKSNLTEKLQKIAFRSRLNSILSRLYKSSIALLATYLILLLLCRLFSLIPDYFHIATLIIPFLAALLISLLLNKTPENLECAKLADNTLKSKDLFATAISIDHAYGEFSPIVVKNAEEQAGEIDPEKVVKLSFSKELRTLVPLTVIIAVTTYFLPHFDLLGKEQAKKREKENRQALEKTEKAVKERMKILQKRSTAKNSPEVEQLLAELKDQFKSLKKSEKAANREKLNRIEQKLSQVWKEKQNEKLRDQLQSSLEKQSFGILDKKEQTWQKELKNNKFDSLKKEINEIKKLAQKISEMTDSKEKQALQKELNDRMKRLSNFMNSQLGSKSAQAALNSAIKQSKMSNLNGLNKNAMKSMQNSMQLLQRELDHLNQMQNDINQMEMAMKATQLAKQLNQLGEMKNAEQGGVQSIEDYANFYKKMMESAKKSSKGKGDKPGAGGAGPHPEENKNAKTSTKKEVSKSQLQPGKILMKWNTRGVGKTGKAQEEYKQSVQEVKQGVSEAILKEQIPPGYHKSIQKYFDNLDK